MGAVAFFPNGTQFNRSMGYGTSAFITYQRLKSRDFIKGNDVYILLTMEGMWVNTAQCELFVLLLQPLMIFYVLLPSIFSVLNVGGNGQV